MPRNIDLYELLGVSRNASEEELRRSYLKLAHKYHPDKTGGDKEAENKLKQINAAYDILKNPDKRRQYDAYGEEGAGGGGFRGAGFGDSAGGFDSPFEDFFDVLFGRGGQRRQSARPGNDLECRITITLQEAAAGTKKTVRFTRQEQCGDCGGSGAAAGTKPDTCPTCQGSGQVRAAHGFFSVTQTCPRCRGTGRVTANPCSRCSGAGMTRQRREISVDVPAGVDTGISLRVTSEGEPGSHGGPRGDLHIHIEVEAHELFRREGSDIICEVPISVTDAALGATVVVPTLRGDVELKVPAGTQNGAMLRMRGLGTPGLRGYRQGDQIVHVMVEVPTKLGRKQRELLKEMAKTIDEKSYPAGRRFRAKCKGKDKGKAKGD